MVAKQETLEIINRGVETWNEWRKKHPAIKPKLNSVDLRNRDLAGIDLHEADLHGANFSGANLKGANFRGAKTGIPETWVIIWILIGGTTLIDGTLLFVEAFSKNGIQEAVGTVLLIFFIIASVVVCIGGGGILSLAGVFFLLRSVPEIISAAENLNGGENIDAILYLEVIVAIGTAMLMVIFMASAGMRVVSVSLCVTSFVFLFLARVATILNPTIKMDVLFSSSFTAFIFSLIVLFLVFTKNSLKIIFWYPNRYQNVNKLNIWTRIACSLGTKFTNSDLTRADFQVSTLYHADFRNALIYKTCFINSKGLCLSKLDGTCLEPPAVQRLFSLLDGQGKNFSNLDLTGAQIANANLKNAVLSGCKLIDANLQNVNLFAADSRGTDFSSSNMTGACIDSINHNSQTSFTNVSCEYIYFKYDTRTKTYKDRPSKGF